jgi:hypothetical protein
MGQLNRPEWPVSDARSAFDRSRSETSCSSFMHLWLAWIKFTSREYQSSWPVGEGCRIQLL